MIKSLKNQIFSLLPAVNRLETKDYLRKNSDEAWYDLWTNYQVYEEDINFDELNNSSGGIRGILNENFQVKGIPSPIVMYGWLDLLEKTELPSNNLEWPIASNRLLEILGTFLELEKYPIRILERSQFEHTYEENLRKYEIIEYSENLVCRDNWYYGFQVKNKIKLLDEKSDLLNEKYVFANTLETLPHFFYDEMLRGQLFCSIEGRKILEKEDIRGIQFVKPFE
jgi:hypothetical protein